MLRAACLLVALLGAGCADNPYVIGRYLDAGSDECKGARAHAAVCDGFEHDDLSAPGSTVIEIAGAVERSAVRAHDGRFSLHASSDAAMSVGVVVKRFTPVRSGELYLRLYLFVPANLPTETMNFLFVGDDPNPDPTPFKGIDFNLLNGALQVYSPQGMPLRQMATSSIPRGRWFCFRAEISIKDSGGTVRTFVDDQLVLEATGIDTLPDAGVHLLRAGIDWSSNQDAAFELFIDDLVLDTRPVACQP
jgi:hypothetical protein